MEFEKPMSVFTNSPQSSTSYEHAFNLEYNITSTINIIVQQSGVQEKDFFPEIQV